MPSISSEIQAAVQDPNLSYWMSVLGEANLPPGEYYRLTSDVWELAVREHGLEDGDRSLVLAMIRARLPKREGI